MRKLDPFLLSLICAIALASLLPVSGRWATILHDLTLLLIAFMFFLHGARLEPRAVLESVRDWKLQSAVVVSTFAAFPLLGLAFSAAWPGLLPADLWRGVLFLCCLPSTVQSSIALTSIARGNVPASICAATLSNLAGILITPVLVTIVLHQSSGISAMSVIDIATQLLLPFGLGQLLHTRLHRWAHRNKKLLSLSDRGSIVLVVYSAFSAAVVEGVWHRVSARDLITSAATDGVLLAIVLLLTSVVGRLLRLPRPGQISLTLCGSKKSLATGVPMANVLFPAATVGTIILPLMMYHQIQLFICTLLARHWSKRPEDPA